MSFLNKDVLLLIFEELQDDSKSLFSCLMVNRLWCEVAVPVLWRNPWSYSEQRIQLPPVLDKSLLFDYLSFCRSINVNTINSIISIGSSSTYNQFFIQQEFYYLFMKKCPELKYLDMKSIKHQIFYFPESKIRLESLCELRCDTSIDSSYFYGLSQFCQYIQRFIIDNIETRPNNGIAKLIEVQKNLKHFEWVDDLYDDYLDEDPYEEILLALEKKAYSLNYLRIFIKYVDDIGHTLLQEILSKFYKLKTLIIEDFLYFTLENLKQLKIQAFHELEILNIEYNSLNIFSNIIENGGGRLKKILFRPYDSIECNYPENSLNFIRAIYKNCPLIEYLSIIFLSSKEHFAEFEELLKVCKNLKSLLVVTFETEISNEKILKNGEELLKVLVKSAPTNLKEFRFGDEFRFSLKNLEEFFKKWRCRPALSILTIDSIYIGEDYTRLIDKYKSNGVIKDFKYVPNIDQINY
ncbi:hypothetical protein RirG_106740 [Rhizophagus irregularis DAOM 197198w]|uniref:F-box domain-containing protein n=1 Tax=Rhizophagus irregularis (strain DAOM 197198w) TaxID=1432141 RepID=A0A015JFJ0_RHIIW|nr:hypothetical protein RirG_106740 [Rhizophagus irregularis DAOM 197198w]